MQPPPISTKPLRPKGRILPCRDGKELRGELVNLIEKQIETLANQSCDGLTEAELHEYDDRRAQIDELYDALDHLDFAA